MSGGSYNYVYVKIDDAATQLSSLGGDARRMAFAQLLKLVADAMHDIEWVDSGDFSPGDEHTAIDKVFGFLKSNPKTVAKARAYDSMVARIRKAIET